MRPELTQIERIDNYLNGTMSGSELQLFKQELATNPELQEMVETQELMHTAVARKAMLLQVQSFAPPLRPGGSGILSQFKWPIILSSIVVGALITWASLHHSEREQKLEAKKHESLHKKEASSEAQNSTDLLPTLQSEDVASNTHLVPNSKKSFGGLTTWISPEVQQITIDPNKENLVACKNGSVILVPEKAFVDNAGKTVTTPVTLDVIEALTLDKMIGYNLSTMTGKTALRSGGMLYIQPKSDNQTINLASGKAFHIEVPTDNYNPEMMAWQGVPDRAGNLNWENPQEIENFLIPVDIASLDFLPAGFREEVRATLPFKSYAKSSKKLEDSLYYALSDTECAPVTEVRKPTSVAPKSQGKQESKVEIETDALPLPITVSERHGGKQKNGLIATEVFLDNYPQDGLPILMRVNCGEDTQSQDISSGHATIHHKAALGGITIQYEKCPPLVFDVDLRTDKPLRFDCSTLDCRANFKGSAVAASKTNTTCYIDPASIFAIHQNTFNNTFIATKEFAERLQALHRIKNAQSLLELYVNQLDKNLYEIDAEVAAKLSGTDRTTFETFASQKATNVKPNGQDYTLLQKHYKRQQELKQAEVAEMQRKYAAMSDEQLNAFNQQLQDLRAEMNKKRSQILSDDRHKLKNSNSNLLNTFVQNNSQPVVGVQASYKVSWFNTGWMNIDAYLHELSKGEKIVSVDAAHNGNTKIYQTVNSLQTLVPLNNSKGNFEAHFPTSSLVEQFKNSACLAMERLDDGRFFLAVQDFNPYTTEVVKLSGGKVYSERELKNELEILFPYGQMLSVAIDRETDWIRSQKINAERARQFKLDQDRKQIIADNERDQKLAAVNAQEADRASQIETKRKEFENALQREAAFMEHLKQTIDPCADGYKSALKTFSTNTNQIVSFPDQDAQFPGGYAEMQRFIAENIHYPEEALEANISGKIYISMTVLEDGTLGDLKVTSPIPTKNPLEVEALRLVGTMPKWEPAIVGGVPVKSRINLPVIFTLN